MLGLQSIKTTVQGYWLPRTVRRGGRPATVARALLLFRLIVRPMVRDRTRALLTVSAVTLGVAVIVAVDLAGEASMGSFRSSLESLQGTASYEITQVGGIPEAVYGDLVRLEEPLVFSPRIEGFASLVTTGEEVPLFGVDLIGDTTLGEKGAMPRPGTSELVDSASVWASDSLGIAPGAALAVVAGDRRMELAVRGVIEPSEAHAGRYLMMDIAAAQRLLARTGRLDRIYVHAPPGETRDWEERLRLVVPPGAAILPAGTRTEDNRRMLRAFRWNLRMMSYTTILVGAFLIYNTITAYVVRRRQQIGIVRAVGGSRAMVRSAFLFEGVVFGILGAAAGLVVGRLLAVGAVEAVGGTVSSLYVTSTPGDIAFRPWTVALAVLTGVGTSIASAWWPAREAAGVAPTEAMARARLDYDVRTASGRSTLVAVVLTGLAIACCFVPPVDRFPAGGYLAPVLLAGAVAMVAPRLSAVVLRIAGRALAAPLGIIANVAARGLAASLGRTSVIVTAMAVATALIVSMGVTVGSFRETVVDWLESRLQADYYVSPAGPGSRGAASTMSEEVAARLETVPGVMDVGRFRTYSIRYEDTPATLGLGDAALYERHPGGEFLDGSEPAVVWEELAEGDRVIVSELFSYRHDVHRGDTIRLALGSGIVEFGVAAVFYDYSGEREFLIGDREALLEYLPDPRLSSAAVYLEPGADFEASHATLLRTVSGRGVEVTPTRTIREEAIRIFDRAFAITWALEVIAMFVAILGMAEALLNLVFDRRSELALLRMHGASVAQVRRLVLVQAGLLGVLASVVGLALGAATSQILLRVIHKQSFGWSVQLHWPWELLATAVGVIVAASVVAGLYPARIGSRLAPVEVLRAE